jgi:hypothetical protein
MRGIDCAHSQTLKTLPWPWFREGIDVLKRKSNIFGFLWENRQFLGFSRREIDARTLKPCKRFLDPDSGKESVYWSENLKVRCFDFLPWIRFRSFPKHENVLLTRFRVSESLGFTEDIERLGYQKPGQEYVFMLRKCAESDSGKKTKTSHFQGLGVRAIDFPPRKT